MKVCISVKQLYNELGNKLKYLSIEKDGDYYDLISDLCGIVCMDGEEVYISEFDGDTYILENNIGEHIAMFGLTKEEFEIATFTRKL